MGNAIECNIQSNYLNLNLEIISNKNESAIGFRIKEKYV